MSLSISSETIVNYIKLLEERIKRLELTPSNGLSRIVTDEKIFISNSTVAMTTFANLTGGPAGPAVTCRTGIKAIVLGTCVLYGGDQAVYNNTGSSFSYAVSGATVVDPNSAGSPTAIGSLQYFATGTALAYSIHATVTFLDIITLNPGDNTFTMKFRYDYSPAGAGAAHTLFENPALVVIPVDV